MQLRQDKDNSIETQLVEYTTIPPEYHLWEIDLHIWIRIISRFILLNIQRNIITYVISYIVLFIQYKVRSLMTL